MGTVLRVAREIVESAEHTNKWTFVAPVRRQLIESVATALAACALDEAKWWEPYVPEWFLTAAEQRMMVERLAALERAAGEKAT